MIKVTELKKEYKTGKETVQVLKGVDFSVEEGEFVCIIGPSGSGKTTLLHLLGGLDTPTSGSIKLDGVDIALKSEKERTLIRRKDIGLIFQNYQLLPTLTIYENIVFPLHADGKKVPPGKVEELLAAVDLVGYEKRFPNELSGGQQQRVAIARALIHEPSILLADEPTGNLDRQRSSDTLDLLANFHLERKQTIVMVTHDMFAAGYADRIVLFKDGLIEAEVTREDEDYAKFLSRFLA
ncbi:ABC transporter ATP-binding protein [Ornithinibacillus massiliensis]|uniref:ABC transporter ATP-binding protein n=1 Tax=Ornithinibacillus massiliensis TaxID=1944633 RepID=A0ABS5MF28_9BACI|nr:ABC transporter ATP-binding protein [Ornithinibacillus massiliensis]MBS3680936.1 ABC transporter ATP-binding protein [Ornithinibacillus massiliensis]